MEHEDQSDLHRERRWLTVSLGVLAVVVGLGAAFALGVSVGAEADDQPDSPGQHLEAWNDCLAEAGAVVPVVEAREDGGFTVTVTAEFFETFDPEAFLRALVECERLAPVELLTALRHFVGIRGDRQADHRLPGLPFDLSRRELAEACERLRATDRVPEDLPEGLLRACEALHD